MCKLLFNQLHAIGFFHSSPASLQALKSKSGIVPAFDRWLDESINFLSQEGYISLDGHERLTVVREVATLHAVWQEWEEGKQIWLKDGNLKAKVVASEATMRVLPDILIGKIPATDILFPNASMDIVEGIYKNNPVADYFNEVLSDLVSDYIDERVRMQPSACIRILEIGAGTGGTSYSVLQKLAPYKANVREYCYTDLSKAFLFYAEQTYGPEYPFLQYRLLHAEKPLMEQGIDLGGYDIVIAANVLHATKDIKQTIRNAKSALKKNGLLLLNELTENSIINHLTFGLLEGWWLYEDPWLRIPGCPGLTVNDWQAVLESEGFNSFYLPAEHEMRLGQQIIVAESDGVIRERIGDIAVVQQRSQIPKQIRNDAAKALASVKPLGTQHRREEAMPLEEYSDSYLEDRLRQVVVEALSVSLKVKRDRIDMNLSFYDYGLDSITGVQMVRNINELLELNLKTTDLFDHYSVTLLVAYILSEHRSKLALLLQPNPNRKTLPEPLRENERSQPQAPKKIRQTRFNRIETGNRIAEKNGTLKKSPIAIIGMSGRFGEADHVEELWAHLAAGNDLVGEVTRWDLRHYYKNNGNSNYCNHGSFLKAIDSFDATFFNISGLEAAYMDPQQRIFLEESWKALEDAGYAGAEIQGRKCGVYVGCQTGDYHYLYGEQPPAQSTWGRSSSIIASRISYYLNLQGPALAIDTACSSSLVAIHLACQALWSQETEMALAGGVYVRSTPELYLAANRAGMLSPTGRCHTFDDRADGFVFGEGAGAVVLKRLEDAIADQDHIYGIIRGSAINQDGKTNGITAPSAISQERLESLVYSEFNIQPDSIQLVEAHGTGTILGDPIEIEALTRSFRKFTDKKGYCAIGSIKTNIGHTANAAGVAGLIKILLAFKYKQLPPSIHYKTGNPNISFDESPFYVNTSLKNWDSIPDSTRRAALSSFGFSGTNAHMVIEEAPAAPTKNKEVKPAYMIVLSARTAKQLNEQAVNLVRYCQDQDQESTDIGDMSHTLLLGRKHLGHRLAFIASTTHELVEQITQWLSNEATSVFHQDIQENRLQLQPSLKRYGNHCIDICMKRTDEQEYREHLSAIASLFVQGYELNYGLLFTTGHYSRISLPSYPFAKDRYWVPESGNVAGGVHAAASASLHPLVQVNTSTLSEQRYCSVFSGEEFYLKDHVVSGRRLLPGVAYLEMARAALELGAGGKPKKQGRLRLKNIVWSQPVAVEGQPIELKIGLYPEASGEITFDIYSERGLENANRTIHSRGSAVPSEAEAAARLDWAQVRERCGTGMYTSAECYRRFEEHGFSYGPGHRGIECLYIGEGEVLAQLSLPQAVSGTKDEYVLHPSLMDGALQAIIGLLAEGEAKEPLVPFAVEELDIVGSCTERMWAHLRYSSSGEGQGSVRKIDVDLSTEAGDVCVRMRGFTVRALAGIPATSAKASRTGLLFRPVWREEEAVSLQAEASMSHLVVLAGSSRAYGTAAVEEALGGRCIALQDSLEGDKGEQYTAYALQLLNEIQILFCAKGSGEMLLQLVVAGSEEELLYAGLCGLLRTARLENHRLKWQFIAVEPGMESGEFVQLLERNQSMPEGRIRYRNQRRLVAGWEEMDASGLGRPWRAGGVYLITGGAGGLGRLFAQEIGEQAEGSVIILAGRSPLSVREQEVLRQLEKKGSRIVYRQADLGDRSAVEALVSGVKAEFGAINGILHGAGVNRDNFITNKTSEEMKEVLGAKVTGLLNLDEATQAEKIDFMILFSSASGALGNIGQADYAAGNAFMDEYAEYRSGQVEEGARHGRTLAINWPLWEAGGMQVSDETKRLLRHRTGMEPLQTEVGMHAFYTSFRSTANQVLVLSGDKNKLKMLMLSSPLKQGTVPFSSDVKGGYSHIFEQISEGKLCEDDFLQLLLFS